MEYESDSYYLAVTPDDLVEWIRLKESGVSKKYSQELARRAMDAMHELLNDMVR